MSSKTKRITESAMLLAVAIVLELVAKMVIPEMPFGGQITLVSMLPVVLISYRHGVKWGLVAGVTYAVLEMALGAKTVAAAFQPGYFGDEVMLLNAFIMCILDYIVAFTVLGLGGLFRNKCKKPATGILIAANVIAALLFAAGHLPATAMLMGITPMILFRCFLLNGGFGLLFGWLYRKYGLRYAMIAHGGCHVVSKLIWILFV